VFTIEEFGWGACNEELFVSIDRRAGGGNRRFVFFSSRHAQTEIVIREGMTVKRGQRLRRVKMMYRDGDLLENHLFQDLNSPDYQ
jgi:hypothetical protein